MPKFNSFLNEGRVKDLTFEQKEAFKKLGKKFGDEGLEWSGYTFMWIYDGEGVFDSVDRVVYIETKQYDKRFYVKMRETLLPYKDAQKSEREIKECLAFLKEAAKIGREFV